LNTKRIVITGGPGTGKTSIINELIKRNYTCLEEISRQITLDARAKGTEQLFLTNPLLFSDLLLKGRLTQFEDAKKSTSNLIFYDRGIPDITAYMNYANNNYSSKFIEACKNNIYDTVFVLAPWQAIFESDNERYENFEQTSEIHQYLIDTYNTYGYSLIDVPFDTVSNRTNFILNQIEAL